VVVEVEKAITVVAQVVLVVVGLVVEQELPVKVMLAVL
jgi:hypothetical protein